MFITRLTLSAYLESAGHFMLVGGIKRILFI